MREIRQDEFIRNDRGVRKGLLTYSNGCVLSCDMEDEVSVMQRFGERGFLAEGKGTEGLRWKKLSSLEYQEAD